MKLRLKKKFKITLLVLFLLGLLYGYYKILYESERPTENDEPTKIEEKISKAKLSIVGDFLYEEFYYDALSYGENIDLYFNKVKDTFQNDDLSIGNMEVVIGNENLEVSGSGFSFCAPKNIGHQVIDLGMDILSTANNHSNDRGLEGRISTIDFFKEHSDILTVGTYDEERDVTKNIKVVDDIEFGFLAYTYGTNVKVDKDLRDGIGLFRDPDGIDHTSYENLMKEEIETLRKEVDCLIVLMHWGVEFTYEPNDTQRTLAEMMNSLGVDIIVGSHSHSIQPIEWINSDKHDTLVYYSLGNFVSADQDISRTGEKFDNAYQMGLISNLEVTKDKNGVYISDVTTTPIINYYDANLKNFEIIPLDEYTEDYEKTHYRYKYNFDRKFIEEAYETVIDEEFR